MGGVVFCHRPPEQEQADDSHHDPDEQVGRAVTMSRLMPNPRLLASFALAVLGTRQALVILVSPP